jgi:hypothetical protein
VLVGQSLINAAALRATVSQIEKYNQAANAFYGKYGYLPGDIPAGPAAQFGFAARGTASGQGDGNGVIQGSVNGGMMEGGGETAMFWVDLSTVGLIAGSFSAAVATSCPYTLTSTSNPNLNAFFPAAKLGQGNYIYVWSGPFNGAELPGNINSFGISALTAVGGCGNAPVSNPALTVSQAYAIDSKIDDGLPQSGNVLALYINFAVSTSTGSWAASGGVEGAHTSGWSATGNQPTTAATPGSTTTCYDNGNAAGTPQQYSVEISNGSNTNCALSFKMQAGD